MHAPPKFSSYFYEGALYKARAQTIQHGTQVHRHHQPPHIRSHTNAHQPTNRPTDDDDDICEQCVNICAEFALVPDIQTSPSAQRVWELERMSSSRVCVCVCFVHGSFRCTFLISNTSRAPCLHSLAAAQEAHRVIIHIFVLCVRVFVCLKSSGSDFSDNKNPNPRFLHGIWLNLLYYVVSESGLCTQTERWLSRALSRANALLAN